MGSVVKKSTKWLNKSTGGFAGKLQPILTPGLKAREDGTIQSISGTTVSDSGGFKSPTGTINTIKGEDPYIKIAGPGSPNGRTTALGDQGQYDYEYGPGQMGEGGARALHDRYAGPDAIARERLNRSGEMNTLIGSAMDQAKGLNAYENAAIRNNAMASINSQNQSALKDLRGSQASNGVRGGLASAQFAQQAGEATNATATMERNLIADNINYKREGTKNAANLVTNQENVERDMAANRLNTVLGIRSENASLEAARMQAEAAANQGRGGRGKK